MSPRSSREANHPPKSAQKNGPEHLIHRLYRRAYFWLDRYPRGHNTVGHACVFFSDVTAGLASWTDRAAPACPYRRERLHGCAQLFVGQRVFPSASCKSAATYPDTGGGWDARDCPLSAKTGDSAQTPANSASISSRRALRLLYASNASRYSFSARALAAANASSNSRL